MSFLKSLFGRGKPSSDGAAEARAVKTAEYKGFTIEARPMRPVRNFNSPG